MILKCKLCVQVFPPPVLPRDFRPVHYFRPVVDTSVSPLVAQALQASRGQLSQDAPQQSRHTLDSTQRREMLGETSLQGTDLSNPDLSKDLFVSQYIIDECKSLYTHTSQKVVFDVRLLIIDYLLEIAVILCLWSLLGVFLLV